MKRIGWLIPILVAMISVGAFADTINFTATSTSLSVYPVTSTVGYNVFFLISGPGFSIDGFDGTPSAWFNNYIGYQPGSMGGGTTKVTFFELEAGYLGGFGVNEIHLNCCSTALFTSTFVFPSNGKDFTVGLPATLSGISGTFSNGQSFTFSPVSGLLRLSFVYSNGLYYGSQGSFGPVPEPGTLALVGSGFAAILGSLRSRAKF